MLSVNIITAVIIIIIIKNFNPQIGFGIVKIASTVRAITCVIYLLHIYPFLLALQYSQPEKRRENL